MNWKLIITLSLFGLAMGIATVFVVPSTVEPLCWLAIFVVCAVLSSCHPVPAYDASASVAQGPGSRSRRGTIELRREP
jgi:hypothetical protein